MKKLLAVFMSIVMVVSFSVMAIAQIRPEVTPAQNQAGDQEQNQEQASQDLPIPTPLQEESAEPESDSPEETITETPEESDMVPGRPQRIDELLAGLAENRANILAERTMAMEENRANFEEKKQAMLQRREEALQNRKEFQDKREEFAEFRFQLREHKDEAIANMQENNMLRAEISRLREELKDSLLALETEGTELSEKTLTEIEILTEQIAQLTEDLISTKGSIGSAVSEGAKSRRDLDYEKMTFAFEGLYETQAYRNECMNDIIETLRSMLQLLVSEA